jgi:predicted secreted hydrolase
MRRHRGPRRLRLLRLALIAVLGATGTLGCTTGGRPILANPTAPLPSVAPPTDPPVRPNDPLPVVLPRDDGPHVRLSEWWYYTGHLTGTAADDTTHELGFEYVIFRAERGGFPTLWLSHLAVTDETGERFLYSQRLEVGEQVDRSPRGADGTPSGFDLSLSGIDPRDASTFDRPPWTMAGSDGMDRLGATLAPAEAAAARTPGGLALALDLAATKPAALHDRDGWIDFGPAGSSYYYSRTAMDAVGTVRLGDLDLAVSGQAWFDHQWGDFISVGGGGWDWFAVNLDDGTDLTLSLVRDPDGSYPLIYGTIVDPDGRTRHLERDDFSIEVTDRWSSPASGAEYPAGWTIAIPSAGDLRIRLRPTVAAQELDTRATTGVVYWEGSQVVSGTRSGAPISGQAYVELTGYAPSEPAD